jgi:AcrR family transcriptional regulator
VAERGEQTRAKLEEAASSLFLETGWEATTGSAIRKRACVSQGSWTHAFKGGKLEIAAAIFERLHIKLWDAVLAEMERGKHRTYDGVVTAGLTELVRQLRYDPERCHLTLHEWDILALR